MRFLSASLRTHIAVALLLSSSLVSAQTAVSPPKNSYPVAQDVELGRQAAAEARKQMPIMRDDAVTSYVEDIGRRLSAGIPPELRHPEFRYTFEVVNVREINAFALPGGPMFVNRGMIESAKTEGEVAGVMAHELSHVILRHGTAQASKATKYQVGQVAGAILGSIVGGAWGQVISQGSQFGLGAAFLRFGREYEKQADIEGSHIMARTGYDPRDMANMFKTIEQQGGSGGPQWLSDHPNPGNRFEYINQEAKKLRVENPIRDTRGFDQVKAHLRSLPPAPTTEEATKATSRQSTSSGGGAGQPQPTGRAEAPARGYRTYDVGKAFRVSVPSNWQQQEGNSTVTFAPAGAYGENGFSHGMQFGISRNESHDLETSTEELLNSLARGNPGLRKSGIDRVAFAKRTGLRTLLTNQSGTAQDETVEVFTTLLRNGNLFYAVGVSPRAEFQNYRPVFDRVVNSLQIAD
jgi:Zn-dependent protease with chaperone function